MTDSEKKTMKNALCDYKHKLQRLIEISLQNKNSYIDVLEYYNNELNTTDKLLTNDLFR